MNTSQKATRLKVQEIQNWILWIILCLLPFVLRLKIFDETERGPLEIQAFPLNKGEFDVFHYYKAIVLIALSMLLPIGWYFGKSIKRRWVHLGLLLFAVAVVLSSVFSPFRSFTWLGGAESFQGMFVWLAYVMICFSAMQVSSVLWFKRYLYGFLASGGIICIIGLVQMVGVDIWQVLQPLIMVDGKKFNPSSLEHVESIFFQINYFGTYLGMLLPVVCCLVLVNSGKKTLPFFVLAFVVVFLTLLASTSRTSFYGNVLTFLTLGLFLLIKKEKALLKTYLTLLVCSGLTFLIYQNLPFKSQRASLAKIYYHSDSPFNDMIVDDSIAEISRHSGPSLFIKAVNDRDIRFYADRKMDSILNYQFKNDSLRFDNISYKDYVFWLDPKLKNGIYFKIREKTKFPILLVNGSFKTLDRKRRPVDIGNFEKINYFGKRDRMLNGRGLIFSLGIPRLRERILLGGGANTFPLVFPNDALFDLTKTFGKPVFVASAHSAYLQVSLQFGLLALLVLGVVFGYYLYESVVLYLKVGLKDSRTLLSLGCFLTVIGFLINSVVAAIMPSTGPVVFILLGLGFAINAKIRSSQSLK